MADVLARSLSLVQLVFYGVGIIVGAGIYTILGAAAGIAGEAVWASLVLAAVAAFLTALSYCELASMYPQAGAEYQFLKAAFPRLPLLPFLVGLLITINTSATCATVALAFSGYLSVFVAVPGWAAAIALLGACTLLNIAGIRQSTAVSIALIVVEVGGLLVLVVAGLSTGHPARALSVPEASQGPAILAAAALVFFVYLGFEDIANLAEEARRPALDVPRALLLSVGITTALYLLVAWAVFSVVDAATLSQSRSPLAQVAGTISPALQPLLAVSALVATTSTALIALVSISRLLFGMARGGHMPPALARVLPGRRTPWVAALVLFATASLLVPLRDVRLVASVSALGILAVFALVHVSLLVLRFTRPADRRGFRVPLAAGRVPVPTVLGLLACVGLMTQFEAKAYAVLGVAVLAGLPAYLLLARRPAATS